MGRPEERDAGKQAAESTSTADRPVNPAAVGKCFTGRIGVATPERIEAFARATNDVQDRYLASAGAAQVAPPLFPVCFLMEMLDKAIADEELGLEFSRVVHGEQEIRYLSPLRAGDECEPLGRVAAIEEKSTGWVVDLALTLKRDGETVCEMLAVIFIRGDRRSRRRRRDRREEPVRGEPLYSQGIPVDADQSERYAAASGDHNPIHLDPEFARNVGLPDIILHGFCTMAMATSVLVEHSLAGACERLRFVSLRFSRPVMMGDELLVTVWEESRRQDTVRLGFEVTNQRGKVVLTAGVAEVAAAA